MHGETVEVAHPAALHAARHVAGECGVGVAVGADDGAGFYQGQNIAFHAVGKIGGMDQAEGGGREHLLPLAAARGLPHQRRRVPFAERDSVALRAQPVAEKGDLRGLAGPVDAFDHNQFAFISIGSKNRHRGGLSIIGRKVPGCLPDQNCTRFGVGNCRVTVSENHRWWIAQARR